MMRRMASPLIEHWLDRFTLDPFIREQVLSVVLDLPSFVREDLMGDSRFHLCDYEPGGGFFMVPMAVPEPSSRGASRSVVFKRTLRRKPERFVRWVIAHEFAHAHLRNEGRTPGEDPEHAADALAAEWGFPRPI